MNLQPTNAERIQRLTDALLACPVGEVITYDSLSRALGSPVLERRYLIMAAMKQANREHGAHFVNVFKVGYKRQPGAMAHVIGETARTKGRRLFKRASTAITHTLAKSNDITNADRLKAYREQVALGLLQHMARNRSLPPAPSSTPPPSLDATVRTSARLLREHLTTIYG
jgi:hypothetical protein